MLSTRLPVLSASGSWCVKAFLETLTSTFSKHISVNLEIWWFWLFLLMSELVFKKRHFLFGCQVEDVDDEVWQERLAQSFNRYEAWSVSCTHPHRLHTKISVLLSQLRESCVCRMKITEPLLVCWSCHWPLERWWRQWAWSSWWRWGGCGRCYAGSWLGARGGDLDHIAAD